MKGIPYFIFSFISLQNARKIMPLWDRMTSNLFGRERRRIIAVPFGPKYLLNAETYYENLKRTT